MRSLIKILVLSLVSIIGLSSAVFGGVISKTFEIGEGTSQPFSHKRTFAIPCNRMINALISYSRFGKSGADNNVPLTITLMQPSADGGEGEVVGTKQVTATTTLNSIRFDSNTLGSDKLRSFLGCSKTWSVRVKADDGSSGFTVKGEIRLTFDDASKDLEFYEVPSGKSISSGETDEFKILFNPAIARFDYSAAITNSQGIINIRGRWYHNLGVMPIKMRAELVNPRGEVVAFDEGYPENEVNPCCTSQKLKILYRIPEYVEGTWKIRFNNLSEHDAVRAIPIASFRPDCP